MVMVTNRAVGPRLFHVKDQVQPTILYSGQSADLDLVSRDDVVTKAWLDKGDIEFGKAAAEDARVKPSEPGKPAPANLDTLTDEELRAYVVERGVKADGRWSRERLLDEAKGLAAKG